MIPLAPIDRHLVVEYSDAPKLPRAKNFECKKQETLLLRFWPLWPAMSSHDRCSAGHRSCLINHGLDQGSFWSIIGQSFLKKSSQNISVIKSHLPMEIAACRYDLCERA